MSLVIRTSTKDWNSIKDNKNGIYKVIENLEKDLGSESSEVALKVRSLRKIECSVGGEGYFVAKFANSGLIDIIVKLLGSDEVLEGKNGQNVGTIACRVLAKACKHVIVLDKVAQKHFEAIVNRLCIEPNEDLYSIVFAMTKSPKWLKTVRSSDDLVCHCARHNVARYEILKSMPVEALDSGMVMLCIRELEECEPGKCTPEKLEIVSQSLCCLREMVFFPEARKQAIENKCVEILSNLLRGSDVPPAIAGPACATLTNLLQDPKHEAKKIAVRFDTGHVLNSMLRSPKDKMSKLELDQVLYALQAISVLCTHTAAREQFLLDYTRNIKILTDHPNKLVSRTAKNAMKVIEWTP